MQEVGGMKSDEVLMYRGIPELWTLMGDALWHQMRGRNCNVSTSVYVALGHSSQLDLVKLSVPQEAIDQTASPLGWNLNPVGAHTGTDVYSALDCR